MPEIADLSHLTNTSIRDYPDFTEDIERLSAPGLAKKQAKIIRKAIYDAIDARVRNSIIAAQMALASPSPAVPPEPFDFHAHLARQAAWSEKTFGPGPRTKGVCDHIRKELGEVEADPLDLKEWVDVVIIALDGACRRSGKPDEIIAGIVAKQTKNEGRVWPDWRTADPDKAIEHDRSHDAQPADTTVPQSVPEDDAPLNAGDIVTDGIFKFTLTADNAMVHNALKNAGRPVNKLVSRAPLAQQTDTTAGE